MKDRLLKLSIVVMGALSAVATFLFGAGLASAAPPTIPPNPADPTDGALSAGVTEARDWVTDYGIPAMLIAIVFSVLVSIGFRWLTRVTRRAAKG